MNITNNKNSNIYNGFIQKTSSNKSIMTRGSYTPMQQDIERDNEKKALKITGIIAGASVVVGFLAYYIKGVKTLNNPDIIAFKNNPNLGKITKKQIDESKYLKDMFKKKESFEKYEKTVGKIEVWRKRLSDYFERHFYKY